MKISDYLPEVYRSLLPGIFSSTISRESIANCGSCIMLKPEQPVPGQQYYSDDSKCCTYFPVIPNYLMGYLLSDVSVETAEGRKRLKELIAAGAGVRPEGISPPRRYNLMYERGRKNGFGKSSALVCPLYDRKKCGCSVWKARSAVCATYFCRYNCGVDGENFWYAVQNYIREAEKCLSGYALLMLNSIPAVHDAVPDPFHFSREDMDNDRPGNYSMIWGDWSGREEEFYIETFRIVSGLDRKKFMELMGVSNHILLKKMEIFLDKMLQPDIPGVLKLNPEVSIHPCLQDEYYLATPSGIFHISDAIFGLLRAFDGSSSTETILECFGEEGINVEQDLIVSFYQHRILVPGE